MYKCEYCKQETAKNKVCPNCGTTIYSATGKIICGPTAEDMSFCGIFLTDKYIILHRKTKGEVMAKRTSGSFGLLGMLAVDAATTKDRAHGYYAYSDIQKVIFPYMASGLKKKNAIKIINRDGSDFILIVDQPGEWDSVGKALKKTVEGIRARVPMMEDGTGKNYGNVICAKPYVTVGNFDIVRPNYTAPQPTPQPTPQGLCFEQYQCGQCGALMSLESKFCMKCGAKLTPDNTRVWIVEGGDSVQPQERKCVGCGTVLDDDDRFCPRCGSRND